VFRIYHLLLTVICLLPLNAGAQPGPILIVEHDWTLRPGGKTYGVWQASLKGSSDHWTGVYCGKQLFVVKMRMLELFALALSPVAVVALILRPKRGSGAAA
jgi:hypothetical protein